MSAYLKVRNWVDGLLGPISVVSYKVAFVPAMVPFFGILVFGRWWTILAIAWAVVWISFVGWRSLRLMKVTGIKGDRAYDRKGKYQLSREYLTTESATNSRRRKVG